MDFTIEIVSLFKPICLQLKNVIRKVKDKFKLDKLHDTDMMTYPIFKSRCRIGSWYCIKCSATGWPWISTILGSINCFTHLYWFKDNICCLNISEWLVGLSSLWWLALSTYQMLLGQQQVNWFPSLYQKPQCVIDIRRFALRILWWTSSSNYRFVATIVVIAVLLVINVFIRESGLWFQASQAEKE